MKIEDSDLTAYGIDRIGRRGLLREALDLALKAIEAGRDDSDLCFVAADTAYRLGDLEKAAQLINRLLTRDPEHVNGWVLFGRIFAARNDLVRAAYGRSQAENLFPALTGMGIFDDLPSGSDSRPRAKDRSSLAAEELDFETMTFAEICAQQGYYNKALKIYGDLQKKNPGNEDIKNRVIQLRKRLNRDD
jgi:tetratricopeptide (TPR) repeat protein